MKATVTKAAILAGLGAAMFGSSAMAASPVSYTYGELNFTRATVTDQLSGCWNECYSAQSDKGYNLAGSFEIVPHVFVRASYENDKMDEKAYSNNSYQYTSHWWQESLGAGYAFDVSSTSSAYAALDLIRSSWDYEETNNSNHNWWKYDQPNINTIALTAGVRSKITDALEFDAAASIGTATQLGDMNYQKLELALVDNITKNVAVKAGYSVQSVDNNNDVYYRYHNPTPGSSFEGHNTYDVNTFSLGVRVSFQ